MYIKNANILALSETSSIYRGIDYSDLFIT